MHRISYIYILLLSALLAGCQLAAQLPEPVTHGAAVATAHPLATAAGERILQQGGNAFDAAVAVSAALAVVEPYGSGIGGGGFWLLHRASDGKNIMIDGRETAPAAADRDMYLDEQGEVIPSASIDGPYAAGIPGAPAALAHMTTQYGRLSLADNLQPAIEYARDGFAVNKIYRRYAGFRLDALSASEDASEIFLVEDNVPELGDVIIQADLANTLQAMAADNADDFYRGETARQMVASVQANGGIWTLEDLADYRIIEREPVAFRYRDMQVTSVAPPSSGGVALSQIMQMYAQLDNDEPASAQQIHLLVESMRRAYRDRAEYLGDPDFVDVPVERLTSAAYVDELVAAVDPTAATGSDTLKPVTADINKGADTTHFSVLDAEGNMVAATLSINYPFGSGFVAEGTGVLLNDEMDDFSSRPGTPNVYGLVGAEANAIEPGKRMLSSMSPTIARHGDKVIILGTPGGSRIITMVLLGLLEFYQGGDANDVVSRPRIHHQHLPDKLFYEADALSAEQIKVLQLLGHELEALDSTYGNMQAITLDRRSGEVGAASDPRRLGKAVVIPE